MSFRLINFLGIDTAGYDRLKLNFAGLGHSYTIWALLGIVVIFGLSGYFMVKPLSGKRKGLVLSLHFLAMLVALGLFLEPELRLAKAREVKSPVAVLLDSSESMGVLGGNGKTRLQLGLEWLSSHQGYFESLANQYQVRWFRFDEQIEALPGDFLSKSEIRAIGRSTKILESLRILKNEYGRGAWAGVIILSDGSDLGELAHSLGKDEKEKQKFIESLPKQFSGLGRVSVVLCGDEKKLKDLAITGLEHDSYGFVKNPFVVVAKVRWLGETKLETALQLWQEDKLIVSKPIQVESGKEETVEIEFIPQEVGRFLFELKLPIYEDEASGENNQRTFPLTILRDRIRALYIVGNPSWDEKFLRQVLKKNPSVDLVSFYILRDYYNDPRADEEELALIPFPTNELFNKELPSFDLVIFQNFFGAEYMLPGYIQALAGYVQKGGALIYIGGPKAFLKNRFNDPLEEILPVDFSFTIPNYKEDKIKLRITESGKEHPITRLLEDEEANKRLWESLELSGYNSVLRVKEHGVVLVEHNQAGAKGLIVVREVGKGRVMAVMTDNLWRWHFQIEGKAQESRFYQLFWERAVRWLMKDPEMKQVSLSGVREVYEPGEPIQLFFSVQDRFYLPISSAKVMLKAINSPVGCGFEPKAGAEIAPGKYRFELALACPGGYRLEANAEKEGVNVGADQEIIVIERESEELKDLSLKPEFLQVLTEALGGRVLSLKQSPDRIKFANLKLEELIEVKDIPIWNNWTSFGLLVFLLSLVWILRRYYGLS